MMRNDLTITFSISVGYQTGLFFFFSFLFPLFFLILILIFYFLKKKIVVTTKCEDTLAQAATAAFNKLKKVSHIRPGLYPRMGVLWIMIMIMII